MRVSDAFPSRYLRPDDLRGRTPVVTIDRVSRERIGEDQRFIVWFADVAKGLVCNKTNATTIGRLHGDETDQWPGKRIKLVVAHVDYRGQSVPAIRVAAPDAPAPASREPGEDDDPFGQF
jgi:hypothetical protein